MNEIVLALALGSSPIVVLLGLRLFAGEKIGLLHAAYAYLNILCWVVWPVAPIIIVFFRNHGILASAVMANYFGLLVLRNWVRRKSEPVEAAQSPDEWWPAQK